MKTVVTRVRDFAEGKALIDALRSAMGWAKYCIDDNGLEVRSDASGSNLDVVRAFANGFLHCYRSKR